MAWSGVEPLEGSCEEIARLARVMQQVGALAALNEEQHIRLGDVTVGDAVVRLGLRPGREARLLIIRR